MGHSDIIMNAVQRIGVTKSALLKDEDIAYDLSFRGICEGNSCGNYGKYYSCPPVIGMAEKLIEEVKKYPFSVLYQNIYEIEDSFDFEGMCECGKKHADIGYEIQKILLKEADFPYRHLSTGGCRLCETCNLKNNEPCRHPKMILPSISGFCVNVSETCKHAGMKYINGVNTVTYFGLIYFE